jgi:hypothetical protein
MRAISWAMKTVLSIGCAVAVLHATPSTQIWIPSTDVQAFLKPHLGYDMYLNPFGSGIISNAGITIGVLPFKNVGMEIGVDYRDASGNHDYPVYFNAKIGLPEDAFFKYMPAVAIGGYDFGLKENVNNNNLVYGLIAKNIWVLGRFSLGGYAGTVGGDPIKNIGFDSPSDAAKTDKGGVLASWDRTISEISDKLWVAIDFQSGRNEYGALSFGLAWNFSTNAGVILGYDIYMDSDALKPTITLQWDANLF